MKSARSQTIQKNQTTAQLTYIMKLTKITTFAFAAAVGCFASANAASILVSDDFDPGATAFSGGYNSGFSSPTSTGGPGAGVDPSGLAYLMNGGKATTLISPLQLATGGYDSVTISYAIYIRDAPQTNTLQYSALGNFTDAVDLKLHSNTANTGGVTPTNAPYELLRWYAGQTVTITSGDLGGLSVEFTDTAKIRFKNNNGTNSNWAYLDDIVITADVPEPSTTALLGLGGLALILRRRK
jgi:hypothetical protein